jgi:hypothetical protein
MQESSTRNTSSTHQLSAPTRTATCAAGYQFKRIVDKNYGFGQLRQTYGKDIVQPYIEKALLDHPIEVEAVGGKAEMAREVARYEAWINCVDGFSGDDLKDPLDKPPAMTPAARIMDDRNMGEYFAGVCEQECRFWVGVEPCLLVAHTYSDI